MDKIEYPLGTLLVADRQTYQGTDGKTYQKIYVVKPEVWRRDELKMPDEQEREMNEHLLLNGVVVAAIQPESPMHVTGACYLLNLLPMPDVIPPNKP